MYKLYFEWKWEGHRVDSNHRRTGTIPIPSDRLKVRYPLYFFVGMVRYHQFESHAYRRILLSVSSRASNVPLRTLKIHRGRLSATSPAHHRMAINHLLHRLDMVCFLALGATSYLTKCENLRSDTIPDIFIGLCCVRVWLILKESVVAPICPLHWKGSP